MARVNICILGISEPKWTGMGEFSSDDHYIYYCGQESLRRNGVAITVNNCPKCSTWMQSQKRQNDLCFQCKLFNTQQFKSMPWLVMLKKLSWTVLWRPTRSSRTNTSKRCPFHYRGLECKSRTSRDTWSNRQVLPWSTKWSRSKANRVLPRERTGHSKHPLPTIQEKITHGHHKMVNTEIRLLIFFAAKDGEALYSQKNKSGSWLWLRSWNLYCKSQT